MRRIAGDVIQRLRDPNGFAGPVAKLATGTLIGHGLTGAALLLLARLYTPAEFGVFGMFSAIIYVLAVSACLRFDVAIALPEADEQAFQVFCLALMAALATTALAAAVVALVPAGGLGRFNAEALAPFLWLLPANVLVLGIFSAGQNWFIRRKAYDLLAVSRVAQSAGAAGTQIGLGFLGAGPTGLITGLVLNSATGAALMARPLLADLQRLRPALTRQGLLSTLSEYRKFPQYSVWEALANSAAIQLPIILIGVMSGSEELGQMTLAMMVVQAPLALFGTSAAQVFLSQAPARARDGQLLPFTMRTMRNLAVGGFPLIIGLGIAAPIVFPFLFGPDWTRAGWLVAWMTPWLMLQFVASPVSTVLSITGHLGTGMALHIGGLLLRTGTVFLAASVNPAHASEAYAISGAAFYLIYSIVILGLAAKSTSRSIGSPSP